MKTCPYCAEQIQDAAIVCKHCGRDLRIPVTTPPTPAWSPGVAALLSLFIPGAGHMYKGQVGMGLLLLFLTVVGYAMYIVPGIILHLIAIVTAAAGQPAPRSVAASIPERIVIAAEARARQRRILRRAGALGLLVIAAWALTFLFTNRPSSTTTQPSAPASVPTRPITDAYKSRGEELVQVIRSAGERCDRADRVFFQGRSPDRSQFWNVSCGDGGQWSISINSGGQTRVTPCAMLKLVGVECFRPLR